ncbi:MAG: hypothetical protein NT007_00395 [Candidatus Kapabacteria bacterium]|nr:hypothetical protein [Candidatus Kapabacteria bacterium]
MVQSKDYFVVNLRRAGYFREDITNIGEKLDQDFIIYLPASTSGKADMSCIYLNDDKIETYPNLYLENLPEFLTRQDEKPFYLLESIRGKLIEHNFRGGSMSGMCLQAWASENWRHFLIKEVFSHHKE